MLFTLRVRRVNVCVCVCAAMAAQQTGDGQFHKSNNPLGADHQRNRVSVRHGCRVVLHVPPLVVLGELCHIRTVGGFRRHSRGAYNIYIMYTMLGPMTYTYVRAREMNNCRARCCRF